jgi:hypothetical protein
LISLAECIAPLASPMRLAPIASLARRLPAIWRWAMLECRLAVGDDRVDFMACVADVERDRERVQRALARHVAELGSAQRLLAAWSVAERHAFKDIPIIWIEWDMGLCGPTSILTSICVDPAFLRLDISPPRSSAQCHVAAVGLELMVEDDETRRLFSDRIRHCMAKASRGMRLLHVAPLLGRGIDRCRLTVRTGPSQLVNWLTAIGWRGNIDSLRAWVPIVAPPWQPISVQIEVGDTVGAYLGVETRVTAAPWWERLEGETLLQRLSTDVELDASKVRAALGWLGPHWTSDNGRPPQRLDRSLYFKLTLDAAGKMEPKAYLGFCRGASGL